MKSIRAQMLVYLLGFIVVLFVVFAFFSLRQINEIPEYISVQNQEVAKARADEVSKELQGTIDLVEMLAQSSLIQSMDMDEIKVFLPTMVLEKHRNMTVSDINGQAWATNDLEIDISEQDQFKSIIEDGQKSYISSPFYSPFVEEDYPILTVSHRIENQGVTVGLINVVLTSVFLNEVIADVEYLETGFAYILDGEGFVVAYPNDEKDITNHMSDWIINSDQALELMKESQGSFVYDHSNGESYLIVFAEVEAVPSWTFVIEVPLAEAYAIYDAMLFYVAIGLGVFIVLTTIFAILYSRGISKPISGLIHSFELAASGNLSVRADAHNRNELGRAGQSFNTMIDKIKSLTYQDPITTMYNLNSFMLELKEKLSEASALAQETYICVLSIDDFKRINTLGGYEAGNQALKIIAARVLAFIRKAELAGRYFGDEMIVMLTVDQAETIEDRTLALIDALDEMVDINGVKYRINTSIGVSEIDYQDSDYHHAIHEATIAKLDAKRSDGTSVAYYNDAMNEALLREQMMEEALLTAFKDKQFYLVYQPIYTEDKMNIVGLEALLRWNHPMFEDVSVSEWIKILERKGMIYEVGNWVLETAIDQVITWNKTYDKSFFISVNISTIQLEDKHFFSTLKKVLETKKIAPELLHIEITETQLMNSIEDKISVLEGIKKLGVKISLDDFGTGYSSLSYLMRLPFDILKVDRSFVGNMFIDEKSLMIVESITSLAKTMQVSITAEGVETDAQFTRLKKLSCQYFQGYLFDKPMTDRVLSARFKNSFKK